MVRTRKTSLVLAAALIGAFLLCCAGRVESDTPGSGARFDAATVADLSLELQEAGGKCVLTAKPGDSRTELRVGLPCYFQRMDGQVMVESFPEFSVDKVFAVIGTSIDAETRSSFGLDADTVCASRAQGIVIDGGKVMAVDHVAGGGVWCRDKGIDRKRFYEFAEAHRAGRP